MFKYLRMNKNWFNNLVNIVDKAVGEFVLKVNPSQLKGEQEQEGIERSQIKEAFQNRVDKNVLEKVKNGEVILFEGFKQLQVSPNIMTGDDLLKKIKFLSWSFENCPTAQDTENAKIIKNAYMTSSIILSQI